MDARSSFDTSLYSNNNLPNAYNKNEYVLPILLVVTHHHARIASYAKVLFVDVCVLRICGETLVHNLYALHRNNSHPLYKVMRNVHNEKIFYYYKCIYSIYSVLYECALCVSVCVRMCDSALRPAMRLTTTTSIRMKCTQASARIACGGHLMAS